MSQDDVVAALIDTQGTLFSEEMGAHVARNTPQELFHWMEGAILLSARIDAALAVQAARALRSGRLHKIDVILATDYWDMVAVLRDNGYRRYDEKTAEYLRETAQWMRDRYQDDLRNMLDDDPDVVLKRLAGAKGLGKVGASIFAREAQLVWDVFYPRADGPALKAAERLDLPAETEPLVALAGSRERFVRLMAALTRAALDGPAPAVSDAARR